ncbi:MAG TPA: hypothetical protein V6D28_07145 [Leptolyngbyaceae cyanobacterium]
MTVLVLASSATAYFFSGLICYFASLGDRNSISRSNNKLLFKSSTKLWIAALWPVWILKEIEGEDGPREALAVSQMTYLNSNKD